MPLMKDRAPMIFPLSEIQHGGPEVLMNDLLTLT